MTKIIGAGLGRSLHSRLDDLVAPAETLTVTYSCPAGHTFEIRLFAEADVVPATWECRRCGAAAPTRHQGAQDLPLPRRTGAPSKTPWQQLRERRSIAELEALLEERLDALRAGRRAAA
jgi:hypothetical protein